MTANRDDSTLEHVAHTSAPVLVEATATTPAWTPLTVPASPATAGSYHLQLDAADGAYEIRFRSGATGFRIPAGTPMTFPARILRTVTPEVRVASGGDVAVRAFFSFADRD